MKKKKEEMSIDEMTVARHMQLLREQRKVLKQTGRKHW